MLLVEAVEPWKRVLCCSEAPWELTEKQLPLRTEMQKQWAGHLLTTEIPQIFVRRAPVGYMNDSEVIYEPFAVPFKRPSL